MFTIELLKEAQSTRKDFFEFLSKELPENQENTSFNNVKTHFPFSSLEEIKVKSEEALKQCQNLVLLDKKLKAIASVKSTISAVNSLKIISLKLKNYTSVGLKDLIPLVKEWNQILSNFTKESSDINLDPETTTGNIYSIDFNEIHTIIITEIPNSIAKEIETILSNWTGKFYLFLYISFNIVQMINLMKKIQGLLDLLLELRIHSLIYSYHSLVRRY